MEINKLLKNLLLPELIIILLSLELIVMKKKKFKKKLFEDECVGVIRICGDYMNDIKYELNGDILTVVKKVKTLHVDD